MSKSLFFGSLLCICIFGFCLYSYIDMQNDITELRISIPKLATEVRRVEEENMRLSYEIEQFESPENLMNLVKKDEFAFLKYPKLKEIIALKQAPALGENEKQQISERAKKPNITFASGAR